MFQHKPEQPKMQVLALPQSLRIKTSRSQTGSGAAGRGLEVVKGLVRFLAGVALMVAVMAAANDVTRSLMAGERLPPVSTLEHWSKLAPVTLTAARTAVQRYTPRLVWDPCLVTLLNLPAWGLFGLLGALLAYAGRRRREVNVFAN
jgi:hypothetical protein